MSIPPPNQQKPTFPKSALVAVLGAYVTTRYLNSSTASLFAGGAATGYLVAKCSYSDPYWVNSMFTAMIAAKGNVLPLNMASIPGDNMFWIAGGALFFPYIMPKLTFI